MNHPEWPHAFSVADIQATQEVRKIGLLSSVTPQGLPHITLLTTLMACSPSQLAFGQFVEGESKQYLRQNPKVGFLLMGLDKSLWRGQATFAHSAKEGKEYDYYNHVPMFRYNAYFGVHTVHYFELLAHTGRQVLPIRRITLAATKTMFARCLGRKAGGPAVLNRWTRSFLNKPSHLKFLAYVDTDGYPVIVPVIQAQSLDARHVLFSTAAYRQELEAIPAGVSASVFGLALSMEDVLLRGTYQGVRRVAGVRVGVLAVDWVYNSMPPTPGQIYPPVALDAVTQF
jgi:hypothetical protein